MTGPSQAWWETETNRLRSELEHALDRIEKVRALTGDPFVLAILDAPPRQDTQPRAAACFDA